MKWIASNVDASTECQRVQVVTRQEYERNDNQHPILGEGKGVHPRCLKP